MKLTNEEVDKFLNLVLEDENVEVITSWTFKEKRAWIENNIFTFAQMHAVEYITYINAEVTLMRLLIEKVAMEVSENAGT